MQKSETSGWFALPKIANASASKIAPGVHCAAGWSTRLVLRPCVQCAYAAVAMTIQFRCESLLSRFQSPDGEAYSERKLQVRFDPLLGTSARIAEGVKLQTRVDTALASFQAPDPNCPFCAERIDRVTPRIASEITPAGRIRVGETVLFPNLVPYSKYSAVAAFTTRHWLNLRDFSSRSNRRQSGCLARLHTGGYEGRCGCLVLRLQHQLSLSFGRFAAPSP